MLRIALGVCLSLLGAAVGAAVGVALTAWVQRQGFYAMVVPGAMLGLGAHLASVDRSNVRGIFLGVAALALGVWAEWWLFPVQSDLPFPMFLSQFTSRQPPVTYLMIAVGGLLAFWWGREPSPWARPSARRVQSVQVKGGVERQDG